MDTIRKLLCILIFGIAISGCGPSPQDLAEADAIRSKSIQDAANMEATRSAPPSPLIVAEADAIRSKTIQDAADREVVRLESKQSSIYQLFGPMMCTGLAITGLLCTLIFAFMLNNSRNNPYPQIAQSQPIVQRYPVFLQSAGNGRYQVTDIATGRTRLLNMRVFEDRKLLEELRNG